MDHEQMPVAPGESTPANESDGTPPDPAAGEVERLQTELEQAKALLSERDEQVEALTRIVSSLGARERAMRDNLTSTQARCTELLDENRAWRRGGAGDPASRALARRLDELRVASGAGVHPMHLVAAVGNFGNSALVDSEAAKNQLLTVAAIAMRLYGGEVLS